MPLTHFYLISVQICAGLYGEGRITSYNVCYTKLLRPLAPYSVPVLKKKYDQILETETTVYAHDVDLSYVVGEPVPALLSLIVPYQGCDETQCFLPVTREFSLSTSQSVAAVSAVPVHDIVITSYSIHYTKLYETSSSQPLLRR